MHKYQRMQIQLTEALFTKVIRYEINFHKMAIILRVSPYSKPLITLKKNRGLVTQSNVQFYLLHFKVKSW